VVAEVLAGGDALPLSECMAKRWSVYSAKLHSPMPSRKSMRAASTVMPIVGVIGRLRRGGGGRGGGGERDGVDDGMASGEELGVGTPAAEQVVDELATEAGAIEQLVVPVGELADLEHTGEGGGQDDRAIHRVGVAERADRRGGREPLLSQAQQAEHGRDDARGLVDRHGVGGAARHQLLEELLLLRVGVVAGDPEAGEPGEVRQRGDPRSSSATRASRSGRSRR
jgi:hypothetical protein